MVVVAGSKALLEMITLHDTTRARATGRQRGDGSRPSGTSSNSKQRNR
jgi:hypothetical protein